MKSLNPSSVGACLVLIVALAISVGRARAQDAIELRGYGKVSADLTDKRAVFGCESVEKADILLDKLLADLFWDETICPAKEHGPSRSQYPEGLFAAGPGLGAYRPRGNQRRRFGRVRWSLLAALAAKSLF